MRESTTIFASLTDFWLGFVVILKGEPWLHLLDSKITPAGREMFTFLKSNQRGLVSLEAFQKGEMSVFWLSMCEK